MSAPVQSLELEAFELEDMAVERMPLRHPTRILSNIFSMELCAQPSQHLPELGSLLNAVEDKLLAYCLILTPIAAHPILDFQVLSSGERLAGYGTIHHFEGERYSSRLTPGEASERLMELASCIILKTQRITRTSSTRPSALDLAVYRGVFPVWHAARRNYAVVLAAAPCFVEL